MRYVITAALGAALVGLAWYGSSMAASLQAAPLVCASGFAASGNNNGYTCTSANFVCGAGKTILLPQLINSNSRARYTCGFPAR
jgi:hypothetical protein